MINQEKGMGTFYSVVILLFISLLLFQTSLLGKSAYGETEGRSEEAAGFEVTLKDGLISLSARDASLKEIIEEIGQKMNIEAVVNIPEEEMISVRFKRLSLKDALQKLSSNYGYIKEGNKIARIIILPKGEESGIQEIESTIPVKHEPLEHKPFKFEFDPLESMEAGG